MFWIGLIVGAVVGIIGIMIYSILDVTKDCNCSFWEWWQLYLVTRDVGQNREATLACIKDDEILSEYTLVER